MGYKKLDLKNDDVLDATHLGHIEDGIASAVSSPSFASVGDRLAVKNIDETGMPIEWEAVDPGTIMSVLYDETTTEELKSIRVPFPDPYPKNVIVFITTPPADADTSYMPVQFKVYPGSTYYPYVHFYPLALPRKGSYCTVAIVVKMLTDTTGAVYADVQHSYINGNRTQTGLSTPLYIGDSFRAVYQMVDGYTNINPKPQLIEFFVSTYGTFPVGTQILILGGYN